MHKYLKIIFITLLFFLKASFALLQAENLTLCYHQFDDSLDELYSVLPDVFEWQIDYIKKIGIPIVRLSDFSDNPQKYTSLDNKNILLTIDDGMKNTVNILPLINRKHVPISLFLSPGLLNKTKEYMTFQDIAEFKKLPWVDFGSHCYTHPLLIRLDEKSLNQEIAVSRHDLEKLLDRKIETFAYPFGMFDNRSKNIAEKNYKIAFGVMDGTNKEKTDRYNLNRYIIYRNTTFGEFIHIINRLNKNPSGGNYEVKSLGLGRGPGKYFIFHKTRLFKFPREEKENTLIVIPNSHIGAGWTYKSIENALKSGFQSYVVVNRNNNIPFYRPNKEMKAIQSWGLNTYVEDLKEALEFISVKNKKAVILTWNDGFDLVLELLEKNKLYRDFVKGIIVVNPSVLGIDDTKHINENIKYYDKLINAGEFATSDLKFFLKIKTLCDLAVLKPKEKSPFSRGLGYGRVSNEDLLIKVFDDADHPDLSLNSADEAYSMDDFNRAFMQPLPLFSMVVPLAYLKDINVLRFKDDYSGSDDKQTHLPVVYVYNSAYRRNVEKFKTVFSNSQEQKEYYFDDISTIEIMLSKKFSQIVTDDALRMLSDTNKK